METNNSQRLEILNNFYNNDFGSLVESIYNQYSFKYPNRYKPVGLTENGSNLFEEIENYIQKEYDIPFKLNKHFDFHSERIFFSPTDNFGFDSKIKSCEELVKLFPEYKRGKYYYSIFENIYPQKKLSKLIESKIKFDAELEIQLISYEIEAYFKRFFILGGYSLFWITYDQLNRYGVDEFPHCLNSEIKDIEYDTNFRLAWNGLGSYSDEFGIEKDNTEYESREKSYLLSLKEKGFQNIVFNDILKDPRIKQYKESKNNNFEIGSHSLERGYITILEILNNKFKQYRDPNFLNKVKIERENFEKKMKESKKKSYSITLNDYSDISFRPFSSPKEFILEPDLIIKDHKLLHDYLQSYNEPENRIRESLNLPKIGEGWISETNLYYEIKKYFDTEVVVHHGKPLWLGKQHFDIYFPKHKIAIEYQGDQHYYPIDFFGGEDAYLKNKLRDEKKRNLCQENNCHLIYVNPGYNLDDVISQVVKNIRK